MGGPLLLVAGGSGIVPLRSILAHRESVSPGTPALLLYSARSEADIIYRDWLDSLDLGLSNVSVRYSLTRRHPAGWSGYVRRVDPKMLDDCLRELAAHSAQPTPLCYVCGPTGFVEAAADALLEVGVPESCVRTERFGPTT